MIRTMSQSFIAVVILFSACKNKGDSSKELETGAPTVIEAAAPDRSDSFEYPQFMISYDQLLARYEAVTGINRSMITDSNLKAQPFLAEPSKLHQMDRLKIYSAGTIAAEFCFAMSSNPQLVIEKFGNSSETLLDTPTKAYAELILRGLSLDPALDLASYQEEIGVLSDLITELKAVGGQPSSVLGGACTALLSSFDYLIDKSYGNVNEVKIAFGRITIEGRTINQAKTNGPLKIRAYVANVVVSETLADGTDQTFSIKLPDSLRNNQELSVYLYTVHGNHEYGFAQNPLRFMAYRPRGIESFPGTATLEIADGCNCHEQNFTYETLWSSLAVPPEGITALALKDGSKATAHINRLTAISNGHRGDLHPGGHVGNLEAISNWWCSEFAPEDNLCGVIGEQVNTSEPAEDL